MRHRVTNQWCSSLAHVGPTPAHALLATALSHMPPSPWQQVIPDSSLNFSKQILILALIFCCLFFNLLLLLSVLLVDKEIHNFRNSLAFVD